MSQQPITVEIEIPSGLNQFKLPSGVNERLQSLLDRQDKGEMLADHERREAEGLVELAEFLSLLNVRASSVIRNQKLAS